jgi:hypothetical protein
MESRLKGVGQDEVAEKGLVSCVYKSINQTLGHLFNPFGSDYTCKRAISARIAHSNHYNATVQQLRRMHDSALRRCKRGAASLKTFSFHRDTFPR